MPFLEKSTFVACVLALAFGLIEVAPVQAQWQSLPHSPVAGRHNDVFFVTPDVGWIVNGDGEIFATMDGGESWQLQFRKTTAHFRSVGFLDKLRGWAGNVGPGEFGATDPTILYETLDGGASWSPVTTFEGDAPAGLCGMRVVNDSVVVAVGRVRGPAFFVKTTDGGLTWTSKDMSEYAAGLVDVYFPHPDTGFAVGLTEEEHRWSAGIVLYTEDGGTTWTKRYRTKQIGQWAWKMSFPSRRVGYVSLQRNDRSPIYFLKTMDGGATWEEKLFSSDHYYVQGIGFATETLGWIGGNSNYPPYETRDGGETWHPVEIGVRLNRFQFLSDSLGYAVGARVHKYSTSSVGMVAERDVPESVQSLSIHPNPSSGPASIVFTLARSSPVTIEIFDMLGRRVAKPVNGHYAPGTHTISWDSGVASGVYQCVLRTEGQSTTKSILVSR